jgi:hypothetical protein
MSHSSRLPPGNRRRRTGSTPAWLILVHQLPATPSNARVKTWRRLQRLGAVSFRSSVYVLPNSARAREDFEWLKGEILALDGQATVLEAHAIDTMGSDEVIAAFREARDRDFRVLLGAIQRVATKAKGDGATLRRRRLDIERGARQFHERLTHLESIDFFGAKGRQDASAALAALERLMEPQASRSITLGPMLEPREFRGRRWVTRPRPGIDRCASAWLIRRFIDPDAVFVFGSPETAPEAIPFDTFGVEFSHRGELCTFEVLARRFGITDNAVERIGHVVHDLDLNDERYRLPETATIGRLVEGLRRSHNDDRRLLEQGIVIFEAMYQSSPSHAPAERLPVSHRRAGPGRNKKR